MSSADSSTGGRSVSSTMRDNDSIGPRLSRRSLLAGGAVVSLSALTVARAGSASGEAALPGSRSAHLTLDYRPSQPTGWSWTPGASFSTTIGGHQVAEDFTYNGKRHRISLLPGPGGTFDPVYEDTPVDPALDFKGTLAAGFGAHYAFQYQGGFKGRGEFDVQSYSVFADEPSEASPQMAFGGGPYVVYQLDRRRGDPAADVTFLAEVFLAQDTGTRNAAGKVVVKVFGGLKHGWQVRELET